VTGPVLGCTRLSSLVRQSRSWRRGRVNCPWPGVACAARVPDGFRVHPIPPRGGSLDHFQPTRRAAGHTASFLRIGSPQKWRARLSTPELPSMLVPGDCSHAGSQRLVAGTRTPRTSRAAAESLGCVMRAHGKPTLRAHAKPELRADVKAPLRAHGRPGTRLCDSIKPHRIAPEQGSAVGLREWSQGG
jgi:hypothetical protein